MHSSSHLCQSRQQYTLLFVQLVEGKWQPFSLRLFQRSPLSVVGSSLAAVKLWGWKKVKNVCHFHEALEVKFNWWGDQVLTTIKAPRKPLRHGHPSTARGNASSSKRRLGNSQYSRIEDSVSPRGFFAAVGGEKCEKLWKLKICHASKVADFGLNLHRKTYRHIYKFQSQNAGCWKLLASLCSCTMASSPKFQSLRRNFTVVFCVVVCPGFIRKASGGECKESEAKVMKMSAKQDHEIASSYLYFTES